MNVLINKMGQKLWNDDDYVLRRRMDININIKSRVAQNLKLSLNSFELADIFLVLYSEHTHLMVHFLDFVLQLGLLAK